MQIAPEVRELEELAGKVRVPMSRALAHAGVPSSTYWRWRHEGREPMTSTVRKVRAAIEDIAREQAG